jgi:hypothetical protein
VALRPLRGSRRVCLVTDRWAKVSGFNPIVRARRAPRAEAVRSAIFRRS